MAEVKHGALPIIRRRFTLVELLIVVTIITILAALLLPSLQHSLESTRATACGSNLRLIGIAAAMYGDSNYNYTPMLDNPIWTVEPSGLPATSRPTWLYPYADNYWKLDCPSYKLLYHNQGNYALSYEACAFSYFSKPHRKMSSFMKPSKLLFACDVQYEGTNINDAQQYATGRDYTIDASGANQHFRHNERVNIVYLDWHVGVRYDPFVKNEEAWNR